METKVALLINLAVQKLIKLVATARNHQLQGYPANEEFCELTKLQALIKALQYGKEFSLGQLDEIEELIKNLGDKGLLPYKPLISQPDVEFKPKESCCGNDDIKNDIIDLTKQINYEHPWLKLTPVGLEAGKYEVGYGLITIDVNWNANKIPLDLIRVNFPDDPSRGSANTVGTHSGITLDLRAAEEVTKKIDGFYNDREAYKGQHLLAQDELCFQTKWPCYWGVGPTNALDNPAAINAFALTLTKEVCCVECFEATLGEGQVLYFFFPYKGKAKQFVTENGVINNSFKGTVDGFKTQSLISNALPGDTVYGVIRSDQPGIGALKVCVKQVEWVEQEVVEIPEETDLIDYDGIWTKPVCVRQDDVYEGQWTGSVCVKEDNGL